MQKIKFDFEVTKQIIDVTPDASVRIGAPVNEDGILANDSTAIGVVLDAQGVGVHRQLVVMVAGYCDIIDAQAIWGDEYSAEAMAAMSDIVFCENHMIPGGSDPAIANAKETGGFGWTEGGSKRVLEWDGNESGKTTVDFAYGTKLVKVSDEVYEPAGDEFKYLPQMVFVSYDESGNEIEQSSHLVDVGYGDLHGYELPALHETNIVSCFNAPTEFNYEEDGEIKTAIIPETGTYFLSYSGYGYVKKLIFNDEAEIIHPIDAKFDDADNYTIHVDYASDNFVPTNPYIVEDGFNLLQSIELGMKLLIDPKQYANKIVLHTHDLNGVNQDEYFTAPSRFLHQSSNGIPYGAELEYVSWDFGSGVAVGYAFSVYFSAEDGWSVDILTP